MHRLLVALALAGAAPLTGCGGASQHPLTLVSPRTDSCKAGDPTCMMTYNSCSDLGITSLQIDVGVLSKQSVTVACPAGLGNGTADVSVAFLPGQDFYMVDVSYPQNGSTVYITAGPFAEDQSQTPWKLPLR